MTATKKSICTICSLLCPLDGLSDAKAVSNCPVRSQWLHSRNPTQLSGTGDLQSLRDRLADDIRSATKPLIWIDGADVQTVRTAVSLACQWRATIHVRKPLGARHVTNITCNEGWFGTTLADVGKHSNLVVAIGDGWHSQIPRLKERFFDDRDDLIWWHIRSAESTSEANLSSQPQNVELVTWPRRDWYSHFSNLVQQVRLEDAATSNLAQSILRSENTTILWTTSDLGQPDDELIVYQLYQLAQLRSHSVRCSLLPLDFEVGATTASSTLLWLTGCSETAVPEGDFWRSTDRYQFYTAAEWRREFDFILKLGSTAQHSVNSDLQANLCAAQFQNVAMETGGHCIRIGTAGIDHPALLMRGDHGLSSFAPAVCSEHGNCLNVVTGDDVLQIIQSILTSQVRGDS